MKQEISIKQEILSLAHFTESMTIEVKQWDMLHNGEFNGEH